MKVQSSGALLLHLQYIPKDKMDVSDEFLLERRVAAVALPLCDFLFNVLEQLEAVDGVFRLLIRTFQGMFRC